MIYDTKRHDMVECDSIERLIVDQEVPGSRPGGGTITISKMAFTQLGVLHFKPDIEPDRCALNNVHYRYRILDLRV